jgi:hypothetical protein
LEAQAEIGEKNPCTNVAVHSEHTDTLPLPYVCLESHEQFFSYLAIVTITGDRAANLDLCFSTDGI